MSDEQLWLSVGLVGQAFFWFFSIGGGLTLFTYALHRLDPVFILGEAAGVFIYSRNLYLIWRKHAAGHASSGG